MPVHKVYFLVGLSVAVLGLMLLCVWSPWHLVHAADVHSATSLPRAPIWTHAEVPGASINVGLWLLDALIILAVAGVIVKIGQGTRSRSQSLK